MEEKKYSHSIDIFKGILVVLMILAHTIQFFGIEKGAFGLATTYINLTTFPGFVFSFGFVSQQAYYSKSFSKSWKRMSINILKILMAYYLSSFAFRIMVNREVYTSRMLTSVILVQSFAGWSEFLVSFAAILLVGMVLFIVFKYMNLKVFIIIVIMSFLMCSIPYGKINGPIIALFIGSTQYITFPVIQFLVYYALGVLVSKENEKWSAKLLGSMSTFTLSLIIYLIKGHCMPNRFPPEWQYIFGAMLFVALYYIGAKWIYRRFEASKWLSKVGVFFVEMGSNSLFYLLLSNILIFSLSGSAFIERSNKNAMIIYGVLMVVIYYMKSLIRVKRIK